MIKYKKTFFIMIIILVILIIVILIFNRINKKDDSENLKSNIILTEEEKIEVVNKIKENLENKENKTIIIVGDKEITEKEVAFMDFQINNQYVNEGEEKNAIDEVIKQYVILQDAEKINITLTGEESKNIEDNISQYISQDEEGINVILEALNMTDEEFFNFYIDRTKNLEIIFKWETNIINKINNREFEIEDEVINSKYIEFINTEDVSERYNLLLELLNLYKEYLVEQVDVKYIK